MTKLYFSFMALVLFAVNALSQPVLNENDMTPMVGTSYTIHEVDPSSLVHGDIGENIVWDFSNLSITGETSYDYVLPSSTPEGSSFSSTDICLYNTTNPSYSYYIYNNTSYALGGITSPGGVTMNYSNPETVYTFPFTYNSVSNDDFECDFVSGGIPFNRSGSVTMTAVGYGSIVLPYGTYDNVLKLKMEETYQDVYDYGTGPQTIDYTTTNYYWYKPGIPEALFMLTSISMSTGSTFQTAAYLDENDVATYINNNFAKQDIQLYPNPASDAIHINNIQEETVHYQIFSLTGNLLKQGVLNHSNTIMISEFQSGSYVVKLISDNNSETLKFIKK